MRRKSKKIEPQTGDNNSVPRWKSFEELVAEIQRELSPDAFVTANDRIYGHQTEKTRQIDVSVRLKLGAINLLVVIDAKDKTRKIDVKQVEEFKGLAEDVAASKAVMVAARGYTDGARKRAIKAGIDLLRIIDSGEHPWKPLTAKIKVLYEVISIAQFRVHFETSIPFAFPTVFAPGKVIVRDIQLNELGTIPEAIYELFHSSELPFEERKYTNLAVYKKSVILADKNGEFVEGRLTVDLTTKVAHYLGDVELETVRGMSNELTGESILGSYSTSEMNVSEVIESWPQISIEDLKVTPLRIKLVRVCNEWNLDAGSNKL